MKKKNANVTRINNKKKYQYLSLFEKKNASRKMIDDETTSTMFLIFMFIEPITR